LVALDDGLFGQYEFLERVFGLLLYARVFYLSQVVSNLLPLLVAIGLHRGTVLHGAVLYGRQVNGTEIDPEEMKLLRSLCAAAASAYSEAAMRSRIDKLEHHLLALETQRV
jgi:hypothetical protein